MRVLIFGHSQSGGMGLDLERMLRGLGYDVTRKTVNGANDRALRLQVPSGPWDRVYLYAGGNSDSPSVEDIRSLIGFFGGNRTVVILPPTNTGDAVRLSMMRAKNAGNAAGLRGLVRVYAIEAGPHEFGPDGIHMRPGAPSSVALATRIVAETGQPGKIPADASGWLVGGLLALSAAIVGGAIYLSRR